MDTPTLKLPDDILNRLLAYNDKGESAWQGIGQITEECIQLANGIPKMAVYQTIAYALCKGTSTIRLYHQFEKEFGEFLAEFPVITFDWLRIAKRISKTTGQSMTEIFQAELAEADQWGGRPRPPDVWRAQLREGKPSLSPARRAQRAALRPLNTLLRYTPETGRGPVLKAIK